MVNGNFKFLSMGNYVTKNFKNRLTTEEILYLFKIVFDLKATLAKNVKSKDLSI